MHQKQPLDPQVFAAVPSVLAEVRQQGIKHASGVRNALIVDESALPVLNAFGKPLGMALGAWFGA